MVEIAKITGQAFCAIIALCFLPLAIISMGLTILIISIGLGFCEWAEELGK